MYPVFLILVRSGDAERRRINLDARAHGRRNRHALDVVALGAGRLGLDRRHRRKRGCSLRSCRRRKQALPIPAWTMPAFSTRNSTAPPLEALTAAGDIHGHRTDLRVRHHAARAEHLAQTADERHHVRRCDATVKIDRCQPARFQPGLPHRRYRHQPHWASSALSPRAKTPTRTVRPVPLGRLTTPRTIWSA